MLKCFKKINKKDTGVFAAGLLFGTAGIKMLKISMQKHSRLMKRELQRMQKNIQMLRM